MARSILGQSAAALAWTTCYRLFRRAAIQDLQWRSPDLFRLPARVCPACARAARACRAVIAAVSGCGVGL